MHPSRSNRSENSNKAPGEERIGANIRAIQQVVEFKMDPTHLTVDGAHRAYTALCFELPQLMYIKRDKVYEFIKVDPYGTNENITVHVSFTHDMVRRKRDETEYFEVISHTKEIRKSIAGKFSLLHSSPLDGFLELKRRQLCFKPLNETIMLEHTIDTLNMSDADNQFMHAIFTEMYGRQQKKHFRRGWHRLELPCENPNEKLIIHMNLKHTLLWYPKKLGGHAFEIIGNEIGSGSFGFVYRGLGVLTPQVNGKLKLKASRHATKECEHDDYQNPLSSLMNEYNIAKRLSYFHTKPPVVIQEDGNTLSFRIERFRSGMNLLQLINALDVTRTITYTTAERLGLTMALLRALKAFHAQGVIHRDIKPENIMVDPKTREVFIIDPGLSKFADQPCDGEVVGDLNYMSPESLVNEPTNALSDLYGMTVVNAILWGARYGDVNDLDEASVKANHLQFPSLFRHINCQLDKALKKDFLDTLIAMSCPKRDDRCSVDEAIERFDNIRMRFLSGLLFTEQGNDGVSFRQAHVVGIKARTEMTAIECAHVDKITPESIAKLHNVIHENLAAIDDVPLAVGEFIYALGIKAFNGFTKSQEIIDKMQSITEAHMKSIVELEAALASVDDYLQKKASGKCDGSFEWQELAEQLKVEIAAAALKYKRGPLNLDNVADLASRAGNKLVEQIQPEIAKLDEHKRNRLSR